MNLFADEASLAIESVSATEVVSGAEPTAAEVQLPVDLKRAADIALEAFGGEVVKADEISDNSGMHFQIRLVNAGRVRDVVIDAANGDIVSPEEEQ